MEGDEEKILLFGGVCGLLMFMVGTLVTIILINNINLENDETFQTHFPIWRGLSSIVFFIWIIGICSLI